MIKKLMSDWLSAKEAEQAANSKRLEIEIALYKAVAEKGLEIKKEGTTLFEDDGMKLTISSKLSYSVDQEKASQNPELFSVKYDYSKTKVKGLTDAQVSILEDIVTTKAAKPSFKVEVL